MKKNKCILLFAIIIALIGWIYETILLYILNGRFEDRGFITLPFCPIYGITILVVYYLIGTPLGYGGLIIKGPPSGFRMLLYYFFAVLIPTVCEFIGGNLMELFTGEVLWDYSMGDYSFGRYISLDVSLLWGLLIIGVMLLYDIMRKHLERIPNDLTERIVFTFGFAISFDYIGNMILFVT